jgi:hypothetical protein
MRQRHSIVTLYADVSVLKQRAGYVRRRTVSGARSFTYAFTGTAIEGKQITFIEIDRPRILPDVVGVVDSARQSAELTGFNGLELTHAQFGGRSDGFEADAFLLPPVPDSEYSVPHENRRITTQLTLNGLVYH